MDDGLWLFCNILNKIDIKLIDYSKHNKIL